MGNRFSIEERVRWSDVDYAGIVFYGSYLRFVEIAETEMFRSAGLAAKEMYDHYGIWLPRVQIHVDFRRPAGLDELLRVESWIASIGTKSITVRFEVFSAIAKILILEARTTMVTVRRDTFEATPVPDAIRDHLAPYSIPE